MKKNKLLRRISVGVTALALVSTSVVAASFAKYQTTWTGSDSAKIAKWDVIVDGMEESGTTTNSLDFDLTKTAYTNVAVDDTNDAKVAPGTEGSFAFEIINKSDVAVDYVYTFTVTGKPTNLVFYKVVDGTETVITPVNGVYTVSDPDAALAIGSATQQSATETVSWRWLYEALTVVAEGATYDATATYYNANGTVAAVTSETFDSLKATLYLASDSNDTTDTNDGYNTSLTDMQVSATIVVTQKQPVAQN